eukprot:gene13775-29292_t
MMHQIYMLRIPLKICLFMAISFITTSSRRSCIIIDPLNEYNNAQAAIGCCESRGVRLVNMWSKSTTHRLLRQSDTDVNILADESPNFDYKSVGKWLSDHNIEINNLIGIICESDTGVRTAEEISHILQLYTSNNINEARRDKYMMQESLKRNYLNSVNQILTDDWQMALEFINSLPSKFPIVIKPSRGAASIGVSRADTIEDSKRIFHELLGTPGYANGTISNAILVQEYLDGEEFAVDTVTCNGEHKIVAIWKYDKRSINNAPFVYYCTELVTEYSDDISKLMDYTEKVLEALEVKWGPAHIEIKMDHSRGPILVETNIGRWHGQDFSSICDMCFGCNAVDLTIDALLSSKIYENNLQESIPSSISNLDDDIEMEALRRWNGVPSRPAVPTCAARIVHLVSTVEGKLSTSPSHINDVMELQSLYRWVPVYEGHIGEQIVKTIDLTTTAGYAILIHPDKSVVDADYHRLVQLQGEMYSVNPND